jgi:hypothetical protein
MGRRRWNCDNGNPTKYMALMEQLPTTESATTQRISKRINHRRDRKTRLEMKETKEETGTLEPPTQHLDYYRVLLAAGANSSLSVFNGIQPFPYVIDGSRKGWEV